MHFTRTVLLLFLAPLALAWDWKHPFSGTKDTADPGATADTGTKPVEYWVGVPIFNGRPDPAFGIYLRARGIDYGDRRYLWEMYHGVVDGDGTADDLTFADYVAVYGDMEFRDE